MDLVVRQPRAPRPGETIFGTSFGTVPGGKGLNQAVAAARAGAHVDFAGAVGSDAHGAELRTLLTLEGVDVDALETVDAHTGTAHIAVTPDGENSIVVVSGANAAVSALGDRVRVALARAHYLVLQFELPQTLLLEAARAARELGVTTVLTPAPAQHPLEGLLDVVDLLVPNAGEARELSGLDDDADAARALSRRVTTVVVTRGDRGALVARGGEIVAEVPAPRVVPVDTTGAGDTFVGVLVARLVADADLTDALRWAAAAAALSVTRPGATASMPTAAEIAAMLEPAD